MRVKKVFTIIIIPISILFFISCNLDVPGDFSPKEVSFITQTTTPIVFTLFNERNAHVLLQEKPHSFTCEQQILVFHYSDKKFEQYLDDDTTILFYPTSDGNVLVYTNDIDITDKGTDDNLSDENLIEDPSQMNY